MPGPVNENQSPNQSQGAGDDYDYLDYYDSGFDDGYGNQGPQNTAPKGYGSTGYTNPNAGKNYGYGQPGGVSPGGDFGSPPASDQEVTQFVQNLKSQGYSPDQIQQAVYEQFGFYPDEYEMNYYMNGMAGTDYAGGSKYLGYSNQPVAQNWKAYGSPGYLQQYFQQQQMYNDAQDMARNAKSQGRQKMVKMHMILLLIMMGDITGALRAYTQMMDRDLRQFTRQVMKKLGQVRRARSRVIRNFATHKPPRAYAGDNPQSAARAQDKAQRYTQFVQLSTQLMGELQNTEREMVDVLQTLKRDFDNFQQSYASMRDNEFRTAERIMTIR